MHSIFENLKFVRVTTDDATDYSEAAGQDGGMVRAGEVDTLGYDGVAFIALVGAVTSTGSFAMKAQQSSDNAVADDYSDIEGSLQTFVDKSNQMVGISIHKPQKRYVAAAYQRTVANVVLSGIIAVLYRGGHLPVEQITAAAGGFAGTPLQLNSPAEGTA